MSGYRGQNTHTAGWTAERTTQLEAMWKSGMSMSEIAAELGGGVSRNGVIGKVHRLGLSGRTKAPAKIAAKVRLPRPAMQTVMRAVPVTRANGSVSFRMRPKTVLAGDAADIELPAACDSSANVTIMGLTPTTCRWPLGDPASPAFRYCGALHEIEAGPYCKFHHGLAYNASASRRMTPKQKAEWLERQRAARAAARRMNEALSVMGAA